jgi:hypothetical protein
VDSKFKDEKQQNTSKKYTVRIIIVTMESFNILARNNNASNNSAAIESSRFSFSAQLFDSLQSVESWIQVRDALVGTTCRDHLVEKAPFQLDNVFQPDSKEFIRNNVLFSLIGPDIRKLWKVEHQYYPELLREV